MTTDKGRRRVLWLVFLAFMLLLGLLWVWNTIAGVGS